MEILNTIGFILFPLIIGFLLYIFISDKKKEDDLTSVSFESKEDAKGIVFGISTDKKYKDTPYVYSPIGDEGSAICVATSGAGKTSAILQPTINSLIKRDSNSKLFVIDISGDIVANTHTDDKLVFQPSNPNTIPYDVFSVIDILDSDADKREALEQLSFQIMPESANTSDAALYYLTEGRKILTGSLIAFYKDLSFVEICEKIVGSNISQLLGDIYKTNNQYAMMYVSSFQGMLESANTAGAKQCVDSALKLFATNERVKNALNIKKNSNQLRLTPFSSETDNVFLVVEDERLELFSPLLSLIVAQVMNYFASRKVDANSSTILMCLDEFSSLGGSNGGGLNILPCLRKYRKRKVRLLILLQSLSDLDLMYSQPEKTAILDNLPYKIVLQSASPESNEYFAKLAGYEKAKKISTSKNAKTTTRTVSEDKEWAIEPAEFSKLKDDLILFHPEGYMRLRKNFFWKN